MKKLLSLVVMGALIAGVSFADSGAKRKLGAYEQPYVEIPSNENATFTPVPQPDWSTMTPTVGTYTTLSGFYDYQSNGGSIQQVRVNPATGNIHVVFMLGEDSTVAGHNDSRRTGYAYSSNGGVTWDNFSNQRVPSRRSGFPTLDLLRGPFAGSPVIANHSTITGTQSAIFIDSPEGSGAFAELPPPPTITGGSLEPIWPYVAGASDGSVIMAASQNDANLTTGVVHHNRMPDDLSSWPAWTVFAGDVQSGGRNVVQANGTGRVGVLLNTSNGAAILGNRWIESTNNGLTWSAPVNLYGSRVVNGDTLNSYVHSDFVYNGDTPLFVFSEYNNNTDEGNPNIAFWSQATGFVTAVPFDSTKYFFDAVNQRFHAFHLGWPSIGLSGNTIVVVYQGFQAEVDNRAYHYSDLWMVTSEDQGATWSAPVRITDTPSQDERYPSVSKWNAPGQVNMVWTQKSKSGLYAFPGNADTVRAYQVFHRMQLQPSDVGEGESTVASSFKMSQNYPNPFNPATRIKYDVAAQAHVQIKVYNTLGQEVATLLDQQLSPGKYETTFDGSTLPSGVYVYRMQAGDMFESKRMVLLK